MIEFRPLSLVFQSNKPFWLLIGSFLLINLLAFFLVVQKEKNEVERLHREYMETREQERRSVDLGGAIEQYKQARDRVQAFRMMLPEESLSKELNEEINALIRKNGVSVEPVVFAPERIVDLLLLRYSAEMTLQGPYPRLKQLLADIQNSPRLFCIEQLSFENTPTRGGGVTLRLFISTYFRGSIQPPSPE